MYNKDNEKQIIMSEVTITELEAGIILPDDASKVDQVQAADRLLGFDADGNPTAPTAEQLKEFVAEGLVDTEAMNTALAGKADKNGSITEPFKAAHLFLEDKAAKGVTGGNYSGALDPDDVYLMNWDTEKGAAALLGKEDPYFVRMGEWIKRTLWHAGNFDAQNSLKYLGRGTLLGQFGNGAAGHGFTDGDTPIGQSSSFLRFGMSGYEVEICLGGYSSWNNGWNRIYFRSKDGDSGSVSDWREFYHTGNLAPATAATAGLMSAEDRIKLNSVASALSLPVVTEDMPTTLEETDEDAARVMAVTPQACIRAQRAAQYQMQTDELLYDALEAFARNHPEYSEFATWLEAKDRIRQEFPKPGATEVADGPETDGEPQIGGPEPAVEQKQKGGGE